MSNKKCPFCGEFPQIHNTEPKVRCNNPECPIYHVEINEEVWNYRPIEENLKECWMGEVEMWKNEYLRVERELQEMRKYLSVKDLMLLDAALAAMGI